MTKSKSDLKTWGQYVLIEASKLSLDDYFMQYTPMTLNEKKLKAMLNEVIDKGVNDFWRPKYDPSFDEVRSGIRYLPGAKPAVGASYVWWEETAKAIMPEYNSRLGTKDEYVTFLGFLIKHLVEEGMYLGNVWGAVCNDSVSLANYFNFHNNKLEHTGTTKVLEFCDLGNTVKILAEDKDADGFYIASGSLYSTGYAHPLADIRLKTDREFCWGAGVGWVVFDFSKK